MRRLAKWLCGMVVAAGMPLAAQVVVFSGQVNFQGTSVPYAPIQICVVTSTGTPCVPTASIYSDYNLAHSVANPNSADVNGNYTFYAAAIGVPAFYILQVTPQPGTTWSYVVNGANGNGCLGANSIAYGCTGATTSQGAATNLVDGNNIKPASVLNANVNGVFSVTKYNAVGDCTGSGSTSGCTDNHNAIQAAIDAAYITGGSVYFPSNPQNATGQTVYYTATSVNPKGVSMYGPPGSSGASGYYPNDVPVAVRGAPSQDVFALVDAADSGYVVPHVKFTVQDLGILVDDSVDASANFPTRRPGRVATDAVMSSSSAVLTSATAQFMPGDAGQAVTVSGAGTAGATLSTTIASWQSPTQVTLTASASTAVSGAALYISVMGLPTTQNIGNCGFAYDDKNGAAALGTGPSRVIFSDVMIQTISNSALNHTCGYFFQGNQAPFQTAWRDGFVEAMFPFSFVPASGVGPSGSLFTGIGDFDIFDHMWMAGHYTFIEYNGSYGRFQSVQVSDALVGPHLMQSLGLSQGTANWTVDIPEFEVDGGSCAAGLIGLRVSGTGHLFQRLQMGLCPAGETVQWDATGSSARVNLNHLGIFNITGAQNNFTSPTDGEWITGATINNTGYGNTLTTGAIGNPSYGVQPFRAQAAGGQGSPTTQYPSLARPALVFSRTHDFLNGSASAPFFNAEDLWLWPQEVGLSSGGVPPVFADSTSESGSAIVGTASYYLGGSNDTVWTIGNQIPATKLRVYFKAKLVSAGNWFADVQANESGTWTSLGCNATFTLTTSYAVYSCDNDATGLTGDAFRILLNGYGLPATNVSVAWIGIRPIPTDMPVTSLQIAGGTPMTANHGTGGSVQQSDGTGASDHYAAFASDGSITDWGQAPYYGVAQLVSGTYTVTVPLACTPGTSGCFYTLSNCGSNAGGAVGVPSIGTVVVGTSFVINSLASDKAVATGDDSLICWSVW